MIFATFWIFFVDLATFFQKINYFSGICLSFLAIRSRSPVVGWGSHKTSCKNQKLLLGLGASSQ
ncbi:hypothetical protein FXO09_03965 [Microcystis aeruginosa KLA2]|nr:MAG: hypothetical protein EWV62_01790 [Microcystis aeruginosa Ma_OC_LR_19540900_S633]TYT72431.1 hypothetical protein FXO09_03965 [Microcystis aeruginosa KLA2]